MRSKLHPHILIREPPLSFHSERPSDRDVHPLRGLSRYGPYSRETVPDPIRIATIVPHGFEDALARLVAKLEYRYIPTERTSYLLEWPGFRTVFGLRASLSGTNCQLRFPSSLDNALKTSGSPHLILAENLMRAVHTLSSVRNEFDVLFILIPRRWIQFCFAEDDFNLHDYVKANTALLRIPVQIVREDSALTYADRCSVNWRLGIALYAKAGGIPWKLAYVDESTAYIGLSYAIRQSDSGESRFVTCCSQVFDSGGAGLEFIAYDAREFQIRRSNPYLSRREMFRVMTRSIDLYRRRHAGHLPKRVFVHKTTDFTADEVDGAMEALHLCEAVDLTQIVVHSGWRGARIKRPRAGHRKGIPAHFPVERGTLVGLGKRSALLWTHGDLRGITKNRSYFKGSKGTPAPIKLIRFAGHGPWDDTAEAILGLSKMNWNNDALYDLLPVTLSFASVLASTVKRMPELGYTPYQFRFFM